MAALKCLYTLVTVILILTNIQIIIFCVTYRTWTLKSEQFSFWGKIICHWQNSLFKSSFIVTIFYNQEDPEGSFSILEFMPQQGWAQHNTRSLPLNSFFHRGDLMSRRVQQDAGSWAERSGLDEGSLISPYWWLWEWELHVQICPSGLSTQEKSFATQTSSEHVVESSLTNENVCDWVGAERTRI